MVGNFHIHRSDNHWRYTYAMGFASIITTTLELAKYWNPSNAILFIFPLIIGPISIIALNLLEVKVAFQLLLFLTS